MVEQRFKGEAERQAELARFRILQNEMTDPLAIGLISDIVRDLEADEAHQLQPKHPPPRAKQKARPLTAFIYFCELDRP